MRSWFVSQKLFLSMSVGTHTAVHTCSGQSNWSNSHSFTTLILLCAIFANCSVCMKISALILLLVNIYHDMVVLVSFSPSEISSNWMYRDNGVATAAVAMTVPYIFGLFFYMTNFTVHKLLFSDLGSSIVAWFLCCNQANSTRTMLFFRYAEILAIAHVDLHFYASWCAVWLCNTRFSCDQVCMCWTSTMYLWPKWVSHIHKPITHRAKPVPAKVPMYAESVFWFWDWKPMYRWNKL